MRLEEQCNNEKESRMKENNDVIVEEGDLGTEEMMQVENDAQERKQVAVQRINIRIRRQLKPSPVGRGLL